MMKAGIKDDDYYTTTPTAIIKLQTKTVKKKKK